MRSIKSAIVAAIVAVTLVGASYAGATTVLSDTFTSGTYNGVGFNNNNGVTTPATGWYGFGSTLGYDATHAIDTTTIGSEHLLKVHQGTGFRGVSAALPTTVTLSNVGDSISLTADVYFSSLPGSGTSGMRLGLYGGSYVTAGGDPQSWVNGSAGYLARFSTNSGSDKTVGLASQNVPSTGTNEPLSGTSLGTVYSTTTPSGTFSSLLPGSGGTPIYNLGLTITKTATGYTETALFNGSSAFSTNDNSLATSTFRNIAFATTVNLNSDIELGNVQVTTNTSVPEPAALGMLGAGLVSLTARRRSAAR